MKNECAIVKDLLPLYQEEMTAPESKEYIQTHLDNCEDCRKEWEQMHKKDVIPADAAAPLKNLKKKLRRKKIWTIALTVVGILVVYLLLQFERFLPCTSENVRVVENYDGSVTVYMEPCSWWTSRPYQGNWYNEEGELLEGQVMEITGYTTVWEHLVNKVFYTKLSGVLSETIYPDYEGQEITIFYNRDRRGDYVMIYGEEESKYSSVNAMAEEAVASVAVPDVSPSDLS